jgi:hypothetical protein
MTAGWGHVCQGQGETLDIRYVGREMPETHGLHSQSYCRWTGSAKLKSLLGFNFHIRKEEVSGHRCPRVTCGKVNEK